MWTPWSLFHSFPWEYPCCRYPNTSLPCKVAHVASCQQLSHCGIDQRYPSGTLFPSPDDKYRFLANQFRKSTEVTPTSLRKTFQDDFPDFECRFLGPTAALDPLSHWVATPLAGSSTRTFDAEDLIPPEGLRSWYHEELIQHQQLGSTKHRSNSNWWKESFTQTNFIPFLNLLSDSKSGNDADPQQNRHVEFPSRSWGVSKEVPPTHLVDKMVHLDCWMTPLPINNANTASLKIIPSISFWRQFFCPWICCIFSKASKGQPIHLSIFWIDRLRKVLESSILVSIWGCWGLRASPFQAAWQIHYCSSFEQCRNLYLNCLLSCWS